VVFFQMLYDRFPFYILKTQPDLKREMQKYLEYWYFAPEEYEFYGDVTVLRILNNLLSKCLSVDPEDRPELDWLAVVVRLCF
jgi:serine/threonine protein kinase